MKDDTGAVTVSRSQQRIRLLLLVAVIAWSCGVTLLCSALAQPAERGHIQFRDVQPSAKFAFRLENSPTPNKHLPETTAGGVAAFDYDGDGLTDLFFTNGAAVPSLVKVGPRQWNR